MSAKYYEAKENGRPEQQHIINLVAQLDLMAEEIRREYNAGSTDFYGRVLGDSIFRGRARKGTPLFASMRQRNIDIVNRENAERISSSTARAGKTYEGFTKKAQYVLSIINEPTNPSEKSEGFSNGRKYSADKTGKQLDTLPSIPREKLTPTEKVLTDFCKSIGVGLSIVEDKS